MSRNLVCPPSGNFGATDWSWSCYVYPVVENGQQALSALIVEAMQRWPFWTRTRTRSWIRLVLIAALKDSLVIPCSTDECSKPIDANRDRGAALFQPWRLLPRTVQFNETLSIEIFESNSSVCSTGADDTGLAVWGPSLTLSQFLLRRPGLVEGKRVLELGCGVALPSLLASRLSAKEVIATDFREQTLTQVEAHAQMNDLSLSPELLDWNEPAAVSLHHQPDIVLAADVIYGLTLVEPLIHAVETILPRNAMLLLSTRDGREGITEFRNLMAVHFLEELLELPTDDYCSYTMPIPKDVQDDPMSLDRWTGGNHSILRYVWRNEAWLSRHSHGPRSAVVTMEATLT